MRKFFGTFLVAAALVPAAAFVPPHSLSFQHQAYTKSSSPLFSSYLENLDRQQQAVAEPSSSVMDDSRTVRTLYEL